MKMAKAQKQPDDQQLLAEVRRLRAEAIAREPDLERARHVLSIREVEVPPAKITAMCSCMMWALEKYPAEKREEAERRHTEHVEREVGTRWEYTYTAGKCTPVTVTTPDGRKDVGHLCGPPSGRKKCEFCKAEWSVSDCDFPVGGKCRKCKGTGLVYALTETREKLERAGYFDYLVNCFPCAGTGMRMCNRHACDNCRRHLDPDEDYCPEHWERAGFEPYVKLEVCVWMLHARHHGKCLRKKCDHIVQPGERALWFPDRGRLMCEADGEEYLRVAR